MMSLVPEDLKEALQARMDAVKEYIEEDKKNGALKRLRLEKNCWRYGHYMIANMGAVSIGSTVTAPMSSGNFFITFDYGQQH